MLWLQRVSLLLLRHSIFPSQNSKHPKETCPYQLSESFVGQTFMGTCHMQGTALDLTRRPNFSASWHLLLNWKMTSTTPGKIRVGAGAGWDTLKGLMSLGVELSAQLCQLPSPLATSASKPGISWSFWSLFFFLSTSTWNPRHKPQHFPCFVCARASEPYTAALIVSLKTI